PDHASVVRHGAEHSCKAAARSALDTHDAIRFAYVPTGGLRREHEDGVVGDAVGRRADLECRAARTLRVRTRSERPAVGGHAAEDPRVADRARSPIARW